MSIQLVYITAGSTEEAKAIGAALVESRLAACANIIGTINSIYRWEGRLQDDQEALLIAKTTDTRLSQLIEKVESIHSYDCPCIVAVPIVEGHSPFLNWVADEVGDAL